MTREEVQISRMQDQLNDAYGAIAALIGIVSQLPGTESADIKKALEQGFAAIPRLLGSDAKRAHVTAEKVAESVASISQTA